MTLRPVALESLSLSGDRHRASAMSSRAGGIRRAGHDGLARAECWLCYSMDSRWDRPDDRHSAGRRARSGNRM